MTGVDIGVFTFPAGGTMRPAPWSRIAVRAVDAKGRKVDIAGSSIVVHTTTTLDGSASAVPLIDLEPTDGTFCYEWVIEGPDNLSLKIYTLVPASASPLSFESLPRVRRSDFQSSPEIEAAWEATARLATEASEEARAAAQDAADAVAGIEQKIDDEIAAHMSELRGADAYEVAVQEGFVGTREQWIASLKGDAGISAYQVAVANGFTGTQAQWLASLHGADGVDPTPQSYGDALAVEGPARTEVEAIATAKINQKRGAALGVAPLGADGRISASNLPEYLAANLLGYVRDAPLIATRGPLSVDNTGATATHVGLQAAIDAAAAEVTASLPAIPSATATISLSRPLYIPHGTYRIDEPLRIPPGLSLESSPGAVIKAGATMGAMIYTRPDQLVQSQRIEGLTLDCNEMADGFDIAYFSDFDLIRPTVVGSKNTAFLLGSPASPGTSYGGLIQRAKTFRRHTVVPKANSVGVWARRCSDTVVDDAGLMGHDYGVINDGSSNRFRRVHPWNPTAQVGETGYIGPTASFKENGSKSVYDACYADTPGLYGWLLNGYNTRIINPALFINGGGSHQVATAFYVTSNYPVVIIVAPQIWGTRFVAADPDTGKPEQPLKSWKADYVAAPGTGLDNLSVVAPDGDQDTITSRSYGIRSKLPGVFSRGPSGWVPFQFQSNGADQVQFLGTGNAGVTKDGLNRLASFTTRPTPAAAGANAVILDTTLGKIIFSNGTQWKDAMGNTV